MIQYRFRAAVQSVLRGRLSSGDRDGLAKSYIPRGQFDSWHDIGRPGAIRLASSTSKKAARYHFVPDFPGNSLSDPVWHLDGTIQQEGYTPPTVPFYDIPAQIARFRRGDSIVIAAAGTVAGTPLADATAPTAYLILSDGPDSYPVQLSSALRNERAVFLARASARRWVTSFEMFGENGMGRQRIMLEPLQEQGPGVSDVMLYSPVTPDPPDSLEVAAGMMLGDTTVAKGDQLGIYWESYGAPKAVPVSVELEIQREGGGLLSGLKNLIPGLGTSSSGRPSWTASSPGLVFHRAVVLDLGDVDSGSYTLVLKTSWAGQEPLEASRGFVVR